MAREKSYGVDTVIQSQIDQTAIQNNFKTSFEYFSNFISSFTLSKLYYFNYLRDEKLCILRKKNKKKFPLQNMFSIFNVNISTFGNVFIHHKFRNFLYF